jgi:hypothetical protein
MVVMVVFATSMPLLHLLYNPLNILPPLRKTKPPRSQPSPPIILELLKILITTTPDLNLSYPALNRRVPGRLAGCYNWESSSFKDHPRYSHTISRGWFLITPKPI